MNDEIKFRIAVVTLSDRAAAGERADESGKVIREMISALNCEIIAQEVMPDDAGMLSSRLVELADDAHADLVLTTGGTGLGARDVTPEATLSVIDQRVLGIEEAMRTAGIAQTPYAMLSRAVAGVRGRTLIINLTGSPKGVKENLAVVLPVLPHALNLLRAARVPDHDHQFSPPSSEGTSA